MIDDSIRGLIIQRASTGHIKEFAMKEKGMKTLRDDAMLLVVRGTRPWKGAARHDRGINLFDFL
jgi:type II secretory ATPase GspE/PulE/Tfp pilus assembly ATPase PilB-like protein